MISICPKSAFVGLQKSITELCSGMVGWSASSLLVFLKQINLIAKDLCILNPSISLTIQKTFSGHSYSLFLFF